MNKNIKSIVRNSNLQEMNNWILKYKDFEPLDEVEDKFHNVYKDILSLSIENQFVMINLILNDYSITNTAKKLGVSECCISKYFSKIKEILKKKDYERINEVCD